MYIVETINNHAKFNSLAYALSYFQTQVNYINELKNTYTAEELPSHEDYEVTMYKNCLVGSDGLHHGFTGEMVFRYSFFYFDCTI